MDKSRNQIEMRDVPKLDFTGALCEIWSGLNYAAYHLAYVRVYSQTAALRTDTDHLRMEEQLSRDKFQVDVMICRTHLAAFFWQLYHVFEALEAAITLGQKEFPTEEYLWIFEKRLEGIRQKPICEEIRLYRNKAHELPAIIGCAWDKKGGELLHHFLPSISGQESKESIDLNVQLQRYLGFVADVWLSFVPDYLKDRFPRSFRFPVTVPYSFLGKLPNELKGAPQLEVLIEASNSGNVRTPDGGSTSGQQNNNTEIPPV